MNKLLSLLLIQVITLAYMPVTYAACLHGFAKNKKKSIIKSFSDAYLETLASFPAEASDTEQDTIDRHITKSDAKGKLQTGATRWPREFGLTRTADPTISATGA